MGGQVEITRSKPRAAACSCPEGVRLWCGSALCAGLCGEIELHCPVRGNGGLCLLGAVPEIDTDLTMQVLLWLAGSWRLSVCREDQGEWRVNDDPLHPQVQRRNPQLPAESTPPRCSPVRQELRFHGARACPLKGIGTHHTAAAGARPVRALHGRWPALLCVEQTNLGAYLHPTIDDTVGPERSTTSTRREAEGGAGVGHDDDQRISG